MDRITRPCGNPGCLHPGDLTSVPMGARCILLPFLTSNPYLQLCPLDPSSSSTHQNPQTCFSVSFRQPCHRPCCFILAATCHLELPSPPCPTRVFHEMGCLSEAKEIQLSQAHLPEQLHSSSLANTTHPLESCTGAVTWKPWTWSTAGPGCPPWLSLTELSNPVCFPGLHFL